jgi:hypothetical protein
MGSARPIDQIWPYDRFMYSLITKIWASKSSVVALFGQYDIDNTTAERAEKQIHIGTRLQ